MITLKDIVSKQFILGHLDPRKGKNMNEISNELDAAIIDELAKGTPVIAVSEGETTPEETAFVAEEAADHIVVNV